MKPSAVWAAVGMLCCGVAQAAVVGGVDFPETIEAQGRTLSLSGAALQERLWFDIYSIGLYTEQPVDSARQAIDSEQVKQIRMHMLRDLPAGEVRKVLMGEFRHASGREFRELLPRIQKMLNAVKNVKRGERIVLTYVPGEGTHMSSSSGPTLVIPGDDFARVLFSIWLAEDTTTPHLRDKLVDE